MADMSEAEVEAILNGTDSSLFDEMDIDWERIDCEQESLAVEEMADSDDSEDDFEGADTPLGMCDDSPEFGE